MQTSLIPFFAGWVRTAATVAALVLAGATLPAQTAGTLSGRVVDAGSGSALPGAAVSITPLGLKTTTNAQGEFAFAGVPAGPHTVEAAYLGYTSASQLVEAGAAPVRLELASTDVVTLEKVVVSSIREGAARALNQQRASRTISNIVSADTIGRFPDPNIAEALQRVPGVAIERDQGEGRYINVRGAPVEFSAVSVDGISLPAPSPDTRGVDLDTIPSDIVSNLEVSKTLRPDQDADSIAGAVNIVTQSPFEYDGLRARGSLGASRNEFGDTSDTRAELTLSNVFGADRKFGAILSASYSKTRRQLDNVENVWIPVTRPEGGQVMSIEETLFKDYDTRRERQALTGQLEWRPSAGHRLFVRGSYSEFTDDEFRNRLGIQWADGALQPGATATAATYNNTRLTKQFRHRVSRNEITSLSAGGDHQLGRARLDYVVSLAESTQDYPKRNELLYRTSGNVNVSYDVSNPDTPAYSLFTTNQHLDLTRFSFRENTFRNTSSAEEETSVAANLTLPVDFAGKNSLVRTGLKWRAKDKDSDNEQFRDRAAAAAPALSLAQLLSGRPSRNFDYVLGEKIDPTKADPYLDGARAASPRRVDASTTSDYEVTEDILAAYGYARLDYGRLDVLAGLRVERTEVEGSAPRFNTNTGAITPQRASRSYTDLFPGLHARYEFARNLVGRAAYTRAIARPNYRSLAPSITDTTDGAGATVTVTAGNPALNSTLSDNLDLMIEYYFEPVGLLSAGVFRKDIQDFQFTSRTTGVFNGLPARFIRPENARDGEILGFELAWQHQFTALPGPLSGFGVFANYTRTDSEITAPLVDSATGLSTRSRKVQLPGQSETNYNFAVFYEKYGFNARLSYTKRSDYLDEIDVEAGAPLDLWWEGRGQLDFTASYQVNRRATVFAEAKNLTDTAGVRYTGQRGQVEEYEKFGYVIFAGVKFNL